VEAGLETRSTLSEPVLWSAVVAGVVSWGFFVTVVDPPLPEGDRAVPEEDQPEDDVPLLGGVHVGAQGVGGTPKLVCEADGGGGVIGFCHASYHFGKGVLIVFNSGWLMACL
jgi:hypothetical protein